MERREVVGGGLLGLTALLGTSAPAAAAQQRDDRETAGAVDRVYDWHVRNQVAPIIARRDDGRYTMAFMFTMLVLRPEMVDNYVGFGFDGR